MVAPNHSLSPMSDIMFAWFDSRPPTFLNGTSAFLLIVLSLAAFTVSPLSPLGLDARHKWLLTYSVGVLIYWYLFLYKLVSLNPHIGYGLSPHGEYSWIMNAGICCAFGIAFSVDIFRSATDGRRTYGQFTLFVFAVVLLRMGNFMPAVITT